jgi:nickel transport protein
MSGMTIEEIERAIRKVAKEELEPLKKEILRLNRQLAKPGITEIAGGIGYIAGLIGVALWALNRKERKKG